MNRFVGLLVAVFLACSLLSAPRAAAQTEAVDSIEVSLLTCSPGKQAYELYGHAALRVRFVERGKDLVFNYGVFDFNTPHFAWRFMCGETDYTVGVYAYADFCAGYTAEGRDVYEQCLNLRPAEAHRLANRVMQDAAVAGWTYRYNFLYDNCITRLVAMIEASVEGKIVWPEAENGSRTFRQIMHEYAGAAAPWNTFGQDLILGAEVDEPLDVRRQMFAPAYAARYFDGAVIRGKDGTTRPLVRSSHGSPMQPRTAADDSIWPSPLTASLLLVAATLMLTIWELRRRRVCRLFDDVLLLARGGLGVVVAFLFFCSVHPAVGSNWLLLLLHPLPLLALPIKVVRERRGCTPIYPWTTLAEGLVAGVVLPLSPQEVPFGVYALLCVMLLRAVSGLYLVRHKK